MYFKDFRVYGANNPNNRRNKSDSGSRSKNKGSPGSSNKKNKNGSPNNSHYKQLRVSQNSKKRKDVWLGTTSGLEFEDVCADILKRCGFRVKKMGGVADGGRDIIIWNKQDKMIVECKHHAKSIGRPVVQKLHSAVVTDRATGGIIISTGGFSLQAAQYAHATRYVNDALRAIRNMRQDGMVLVDKGGLVIMAKNVGVMIHDGADPITRDVDIAPLEERFAALKSHPNKVREMISTKIRGHYIDTYWVVDAQIDQEFSSSAGKKIHRMKKKRTYACGPEGAILGGKLEKFVMQGGDDVPKGGRQELAKNMVVEDMKLRYTKNVGYKGRNRVTYKVTCAPTENHIKLKFKPVGIKRTSVEVKILRTRYACGLPDWGAKMTCKMCGEPATTFKALLLCNECGRTAHTKSCGGECDKCKKTICEDCARTQKKLFGKKRFCSDCV